jgi:hypothetical protein
LPDDEDFDGDDFVVDEGGLDGDGLLKMSAIAFPRSEKKLPPPPPPLVPEDVDPPPEFEGPLHVPQSARTWLTRPPFVCVYRAASE